MSLPFPKLDELDILKARMNPIPLFTSSPIKSHPVDADLHNGQAIERDPGFPDIRSPSNDQYLDGYDPEKFYSLPMLELWQC